MQPSGLSAQLKQEQHSIEIIGHVYISSPLLTVVGAVGLQVSDDVGLIERTGGFVELVVAVGTLATGED